jgi:hypothetical protein
MSDLSSDSSSESDREEKSSSVLDLDLLTVQECIREYEKVQKKERKKRWDAGLRPEKIVLDEGVLAEKVKLTPAQVNALHVKERKERTERQKQQLKEMKEKLLKEKQEAKKIVDLRTDKEKPGIEIAVAPKIRRPRKKKDEPVAPNARPEESESEEEAPPPKSKGFQARKPPLEDEIEEKVAKLNKINSVLENHNPYYAMIMQNRMRR